MRILATIALLLTTLVSNSQIQLGKKQLFAFTTYISPSTSIKEDGLDFGIDIAYQGALYVRFGIGSFSALEGGYKETHLNSGIRVTLGEREKLASYIGMVLGIAGRNGGANPFAGGEMGVDYIFDNQILLGLNSSYTYRGDMKAIGKEEIWTGNIYIRFGYSWDW